jgi:hypothetical protein
MDPILNDILVVTAVFFWSEKSVQLLVFRPIRLPHIQDVSLA